jgi:hypothetical protein
MPTNAKNAAQTFMMVIAFFGRRRASRRRRETLVEDGHREAAPSTIRRGG